MGAVCEMLAEPSQQTECVWSRRDGRSAAALSCVFEWLGGRELARAGAACRAWRAAAAPPRLWRRLLLAERRAAPPAVRALALHNTNADWENSDTKIREWSWRDEYVRAVAGWRYVCSLHPLTSPARGAEQGVPAGVGGAALLHAALAPAGDVLAVAAEDASVTVFLRSEPFADAWSVSWYTSLRRRGWRSAARVEWAPAPAVGAGGAGGRLLVAGPLALAERWELLVLELSAGGDDARVLARAGGGPGAGGCWVSHDTFLSLELRLLAPHRSVTTFWLNSATQEEHSEFAGVSTPVLRVYNESQAHIPYVNYTLGLVIVVEITIETEDTLPGALNADAEYIRATLCKPRTSDVSRPRRVLLAACGHAGGAPGQATALGCWPLRALAVPPLCARAGGGLAERVARRRRPPRPDDPDPPMPTEDEMRTLCSPPHALCPLQARLLGLTPHPSGRCVWVLDAAAHATCVALPTLHVLRVLETQNVKPPSSRPHYVQPTLSTQFLASPVSDEWGRVSVWCARSGAECVPPPRAPSAVPCTLLPAPPNTHACPAQLLVLAGDAILPTPARPCPPCKPHPRPPCRARPADRVQALRVTCCPPPRGMRPPCTPPLPACTLDCTQARPRKERQIATTAILGKGCETGLDRVAARLAASKDARRREYLREVQERRPPGAPCNEPYRLPAERECARATDGRQYTIAHKQPSATVSRACGPCREPPPPKCVELVPDNECQVRGPGHVDPCAHHPRVIVNIDRSKARDSDANRNNSGTFALGANVNQPASEGLTSRIMKSLNITRGGGCGGDKSTTKLSPRSSSAAGGKAQYAGDTGWCGSIQPVPAPPRCQQPSQAEKLRRRACRDIPCHQQPPNTRGFHTTVSARNGKSAPKDMKSMAAQTKANVEKLEKMLNTRAQLKETAKGRTVDCSPKVVVPATGGIELPVPPGAAAVRVKVSLDPANSACIPPHNSTLSKSKPAFTNGTVKASPCAARAAAAACGARSPVPVRDRSPTCVSRAVPAAEKCESWLSIKTIQKKIAETCRIAETSSKGPCKDPCQPKPSPCAPATPKPDNPCSPQRKAPCGPPKAPSKKCDTNKTNKKPTCFIPALAAAANNV